MQHIAHIFIGDELVSFRDKFASAYRLLHPDHERSLFTAISLVHDEEGRFILSPDEGGESLDGISVGKDGSDTALINFFEDLYLRKVTVAHPGNQSIVVVLWAKLFTEGISGIIEYLTTALTKCHSNFHIEINGFTHDAVSCFIGSPLDRKAPETYKDAFDKNIARLRRLRPQLRALRLIANCNMNNVSLDLNEDALARICAEHAALSCEHYLEINPTVIDYGECPFESFGISSVIFDVSYYKAYIRNRIIIDKMHRQDIDNRSFNINALAKSSNPVLTDNLDKIHSFKDKQAANAQAALSLNGSATASNVVGTMDDELRQIVRELKENVNKLVNSGEISIFEKEALLSLILGEDNPMFDSSAVDAQEVTLDDIINEGAEFFLTLDPNHSRLQPVEQSEIKRIRKLMRNIALANRERRERLKALNAGTADEDSPGNHLTDKGYEFKGKEYQVNLNIDRETLELTYTPHDVASDNVDLSNRFGPVRDQGKQGSCSSFAVASVIEALRNDRRRYSPAFLYWTAREEKNASDSDSGSSLYDIIKAGANKGVCTEESMPYNADICNLKPSEAALSEARDCMIIEAQNVNPQLHDIKSALADGFPVIIAAKIFDSFSDTRSGFVRHPSVIERGDGTRSDVHGNHAMVVCGYSDKERILIVRNSWGKDFGKDGYCYLPYSYAKKYILQACIITKVSAAQRQEPAHTAKTINFNFSDNKIEAAILQNLIEEDNAELQSLAEESTKLRTIWAQNGAILGNVNNQAEIINAAKQRIDNEIHKELNNISKLQNAEGGRIKDFKKNYIIGLFSLGLTTLFSLLAVLIFPTSIIARVIAAILLLLLISLIGAFSYRWRKFRQNLRDEIQSHANYVNRLQLDCASLEIKAHIYGTILRETNRYRLALFAGLQTVKNFNDAWVKLYSETEDTLNAMTPDVPYPFLAVLENGLLDRYYVHWRQKMTDAINLNAIFDDFAKNGNLAEIIANSRNLNDAVMRGLRDFSMKEYLKRQDEHTWLFLPDNSSIAKVIPNLDSRALPFCPYGDSIDRPLGKYIFVKDISQDEINTISRFFTQSPMPVQSTNPYAISILNLVRYDLESK